MIITNPLSPQNDPRVKELSPVHFSPQGQVVFPNPTIVLFYTDWCTFCAAVKPIWQQLALNLSQMPFNNVTIAQMDCERYRTATAKIGITAFPTIIIYKGNTKRTYTGSRDLNSFMLLAQQTQLV